MRVILLLLCLLGAGCTAGRPAAVDSQGRVRDAKAAISFRNVHYAQDSAGTVIAEGMVLNTSREPVTSLVVCCRVYNDQAVLLGEGFSEVDDLSPRAARAFRVTMTGVKRGYRAALVPAVIRAEYAQ
jgi:hypothetical protein